MKLFKFFFVLIFISFFSSFSNAEIKNEIIATVGNKAVTTLDLIHEVKMLLIINKQPYTDERKAELQSMAMKSIVRRYTQEIEIENYNYENFSEKDIENEIQKICSNLNITKKNLKLIFEKSGVNFSKLIEKIKVDLRWNGLMFEIYKNRLTINMEEINRQLKSIEKKDTVSEYLLSELLLEPVKKDELEKKIKEVKEKIQTEGFEKVTINYSISNTSLNGGDLGWISSNMLSEKFKKVIENTKVGSISDPIFLQEGIMIVKVRNKRMVKNEIDLEKIKNQIVLNEKTKKLNVFASSHYNSLKRSILVTYN